MTDLMKKLRRAVRSVRNFLAPSKSVELLRAKSQERQAIISQNDELIEQLAAECRAKYGRPAIRIVLDETLSAANPASSVFGEVRLATPGETWPYFDNKPMLPICQINIAELPSCPRALRKFALITYFCQDGEGYTKDSEENGSCWELRAYADTDGLVPLAPPPENELTDYHKYLTPMPIRFEEFTDYPDWRNVLEQDRGTHVVNCGPAGNVELEGPFDVGLKSILRDRIITAKNIDALTPKIEAEIGAICMGVSDRLGHQQCSKIGGWPTCIQDNPVSSGPPLFEQYVMQFSYEDKAHWMYGDCGAIVVKRGKADDEESCWRSVITCY